MNGHTDPNAIKTHRLHSKAKIAQRRKNFIEMFDTIQDEASELALMFEKMKSRFEPDEMRLINTRLNAIKNTNARIVREAGLKK